MNTYAYVGGQPVSAIDPQGLLSFRTQVTWENDDNFPTAGDGGGNTVPSIPIHCDCKCSGGEWTLDQCAMTYLIRVLIRYNLKPLEEQGALRMEPDHVYDMVDVAGKIRRAAEIEEGKERMRGPFPTKEVCEKHAAEALSAVATPIMQKAFDDSHARWDGPGGRHYLYR